MTKWDSHAAISEKALVGKRRTPALMWLPLAAVDAEALDAFQLISAETKLGLNLTRHPRAS